MARSARKWTDDFLNSEIRSTMKTLGIERMPSSEELKKIHRNDLHCAISKRTYSSVAKKLGLELKRSETKTGNEWEVWAKKHLEELGFAVELTSTKHPYDLLVEGSVKIDVKFANSYMMHDVSKVYTYRLAKKQPTCDLYILIGKDHETGELKIYVIPSHHVKMNMVNMGVCSKYDVYLEKFDYISEYAFFFNSIKVPKKSGATVVVQF